jgi:CheY-like chemotaxis protein
MDARQPCVMLVEDEPDLAVLVQYWLLKWMVRAVTVKSAAEALQILDDVAFIEAHFDGLLTDYRLPDGSGWRVIQRFREDFPDAPIALMTAYSNISLELWANARRIPLFRKPLDREDLRAWAERIKEARLARNKLGPRPHPRHRLASPDWNEAPTPVP